MKKHGDNHNLMGQPWDPTRFLAIKFIKSINHDGEWLKKACDENDGTCQFSMEPLDLGDYLLIGLGIL